MTNYHCSRTWWGLLLALPMLLFSQPGSATDYVTTFASVSENTKLFQDVTQTQEAAWKYSISSTMNAPSYSEGGMSGISFNIPLYSSSASSESLILTSKRSFTGVLQGIKVSCPKIDGLEILAVYVKSTGSGLPLGSLSYDANAQAYTYSNLKTADVLDNSTIMLEFNVDADYSSNLNEVQVYGLSGVTVSISEPIEPQTVGQTVTFDPSVLGTADLTNFQYNGILFTLNVSPDGDGFETENGEGVIYLATTKDDGYVGWLAGYVEKGYFIPGSNLYAEDFSGGITLKVPKGSGSIILDGETNANYAFHVMIGENDPVEVASLKRKSLAVPYNVDKDTYVYIYMVNKSASARGRVEPEHPLRSIGRRATTYGRIYGVSCSSAYTPTPASCPITFGAAGKTTFVCQYDLDFSGLTDVKAFIVTGYDVNTSDIWLARVMDAPADTPLWVTGPANTTKEIPTGTSTTYYPQSLMYGSSTSTTPIAASDDNYLNMTLSPGDGKTAKRTSAYNLPAGKAYLHLPLKVASNPGSAQTVKLSAKGKLAYVSQYDLDFTALASKGLKAYTVMAYAEDGTIWLTRVMKASAGTPLYLKGDANGEYSIPSSQVKLTSVNMLKGSATETSVVNMVDDEFTNYVLYKTDGEWAPASKDYPSWAKGTSYLPIPTAYIVKALTRGIGDNAVDESEAEVMCISLNSLLGEATGIRAMEKTPSDDAWYNLNGQRIDKPAKKGLYIRNGKKMVVK